MLDRSIPDPSWTSLACRSVSSSLPSAAIAAALARADFHIVMPIVSADGGGPTHLNLPPGVAHGNFYYVLAGELGVDKHIGDGIT